eukprot:gene3754-biopygen3792
MRRRRRRQKGKNGNAAPQALQASLERHNASKERRAQP